MATVLLPLFLSFPPSFSFSFPFVFPLMYSNQISVNEYIMCGECIKYIQIKFQSVSQAGLLPSARPRKERKECGPDPTKATQIARAPGCQMLQLLRICEAYAKQLEHLTPSARNLGGFCGIWPTLLSFLSWTCGGEQPSLTD